MGERIGEWLVERFALFGVPFQNWMAVALVIVLSWTVWLWLRGWLSNRNDDEWGD
jgi:hypothetical protein